MTVRALFFDVFGTVVDWRASITRQLRHWGERNGVERDWTALADRWRALYQPSMEPIRAGRRRYVRLDVLHRENLDTILAAFDLDETPDGDREALARAWHRLDPWPDVVVGLVRLKTRFILAPVSNGNVALMVNLARHAGLPWDTVLGSEIAQDYKPSPAVYLKSAEALGLPAGECMMVAAHNDDLHAARACGLKTAFVPRPAELGPDQIADRGPEDGWDRVAVDFEDLASRLGC